MMKLRVAAAAIIAVIFGFGGVNAKTLRNADEPAEYPPLSFSGKQYVDSRGCVYIRAGIDGNVTWVPRVARNRTVICGFQPTLGQVTASVPEAAPKPAPAVALVPAVTPAPAAVPAPVIAAKPSPAPKPVVRTASIRVPTAAAAPAPAVPVVRRVAPALSPAPKPTVFSTTPAPKPVAVVASAPKPAPKPVPKPIAVAPIEIAVAPVVPAQAVVPQVSVCPDSSEFSQRYLDANNEGLPVRCGPQERRVAFALSREPLGANTRIVPRHVYEEQRLDNRELTPPPGYRLAWKDDRLNPRRAQQTVGGLAQMDLVWTQSVPRRLIDANSNRDVTRKFPKLVYPYVDIDQQLRYRGTESAIGQTTRRAVLRNQLIRATTKTAPVAAPVASAAPTGQKYVQVATFGEVANAERTSARLKVLGLPVRQGRLTRGGKTYRVVLAGPFSDPASLSAALQTAKRAGYKDAFLRK